ncbi:MAG: hypothetical protein ACOCZW_03465, partial [Bacteroidota bacterium]
VLQPDSVIVPVPTYSIHTFTFPADNFSSGTLTNDTRFDQSKFGQYIFLAEESYEENGVALTARLADIYPPNSLMVGDIMVITTDALNTPPRANLRFKGSLAEFPDKFFSEDAYKFCNEYLEGYRQQDEDFSDIADDARQFGSGLPTAVPYQYTNDDIIIVNQNNEDVTDQYISTIPRAVVNELKSKASSEAVDIIVEPGDVFYYKAVNGKEFALVIADIREGSFEPHLKRVTIKFSELKGSKVEACPG